METWLEDYPHLELLPSDQLFPTGLFPLKQPPKQLYLIGEQAALQAPALAVIGAREATPYGLQAAERCAELAVKRGFAIVSGGARGCDQAGYKGALKSGGTCIVVLAGGADCIYPRRAASLFKTILEAGGLLLSEQPWGFSPPPWAFRLR
ncbi:MAG: DNA-protecting protein DprA, partial [Coriobacteriales bacterium]|nr:DNA-protecting protein DprA [Coriobacteriales bacterium]